MSPLNFGSFPSFGVLLFCDFHRWYFFSFNGITSGKQAIYYQNVSDVCMYSFNICHQNHSILHVALYHLFNFLKT